MSQAVLKLVMKVQQFQNFKEPSKYITSDFAKRTSSSVHNFLKFYRPSKSIHHERQSRLTGILLSTFRSLVHSWVILYNTQGVTPPQNVLYVYYLLKYCIKINAKVLFCVWLPICNKYVRCTLLFLWKIYLHLSEVNYIMISVNYVTI